MSISSLGSSGLQPLDSALEPDWVRKGSAQVQQDYQVALGFEEVLTQQLASAMTPSSSEEESGEGEGSTGFGSSDLSSLLPQALSQGIASGGGLGLASQLTRDMLGPAGLKSADSGSGSAGAGTTSPSSPVAPSGGVAA
jgi:Rod binding domain-containing protein